MNPDQNNPTVSASDMSNTQSGSLPLPAIDGNFALRALRNSTALLTQANQNPPQEAQPAPGSYSVSPSQLQAPSSGSFSVPISSLQPYGQGGASKGGSGFSWGAVGRGAASVINTLEKPFVSMAATPMQLGVAAFNKLTGKNIPDPYAGGVPGVGGQKIPVTPIDKPLQKAGDIAEVASYLIPYGRFAELGMLGRVGAGAATGYGIDVASNLSEGKTGSAAMQPSVGTALGTAIPLTAPFGKLLGRLVGETMGVTTGTGYGSIKQAFSAGLKGIDSKEYSAFRSALLGNSAPETIVNQANSELNNIIAQRRVTFQNALGEITKDSKSLDISPVNTALQDGLKKFRIGIGEDGALDFSRSSIRFDDAAQSTVQKIYDTMKGFGTQAGDRTAVGVDSLKQALHDLYSPSSNVRALVTSVGKAARDVLSKVPGYDQMEQEYADKTKLISDIQKSLSIGNGVQIDTAYRRLTSALRLNNEFRSEMMKTLDQATGGTLSPEVAGEQLSEWLPRGLMRPLEGAGALYAGMQGALLPLLKFAVMASPRAVGELVSGLGLTAKEALPMFEKLGGMSTVQSAVSPTVQATAGLGNTEQPPETGGEPTAQEPGQGTQQ